MYAMVVISHGGRYPGGISVRPRMNDASRPILRWHTLIDGNTQSSAIKLYHPVAIMTQELYSRCG